MTSKLTKSNAFDVSTIWWGIGGGILNIGFKSSFCALLLWSFMWNDGNGFSPPTIQYKFFKRHFTTSGPPWYWFKWASIINIKLTLSHILTISNLIGTFRIGYHFNINFKNLNRIKMVTSKNRPIYQNAMLWFLLTYKQFFYSIRNYYFRKIQVFREIWNFRLNLFTFLFNLTFFAPNIC